MRLRIVAVAVILLAAWGINAQEAAVVELKPADVSEVKAKWEALQAAQKAWDAVNLEIRQDYLTVPHNSKRAGNLLYSDNDAALRGFEYGFVFSKDFRFIVPKPQVTGGNSGYGGWPCNCSGAVLTPFNGNLTTN